MVDEESLDLNELVTELVESRGKLATFQLGPGDPHWDEEQRADANSYWSGWIALSQAITFLAEARDGLRVVGPTHRGGVSGGQ